MKSFLGNFYRRLAIFFWSHCLVDRYKRRKVDNVSSSPSLVVMGEDSCPEGRGFKSQHNLLDGHFSHIFVVNIAIFV